MKLGIFDIGQVGLPVMLAGLVWASITAQYLLPNRGSVASSISNVREYMSVMFVKKPGDPNGGGALIGKTVAAAGLRALPNLFLVRIEREDGTIINAPGREEILQGGDKLFFAGQGHSVLSLGQIRGLRLPAGKQVTIHGKESQSENHCC